MNRHYRPTALIKKLVVHLRSSIWHVSAIRVFARMIFRVLDFGDVPITLKEESIGCGCSRNVLDQCCHAMPIGEWYWCFRWVLSCYAYW